MSELKRSYKKKQVPSNDVNNQNKTETVTKDGPSDDLQKLIQELIAQNKAIMKENEELKTYKRSEPITSRMITIVHLCDNVYPLKTHIKTANVLLNFGKYGETATLPFVHFEELHREYRDYFERNVIGLTAKDEDLCEMFNIKKTYKDPMSQSILDNVASINDEELKRIYDLVPQTQKDVIIRSFVAGYFEEDSEGRYPKDSRYKNKARAEMLNKWCDGQLRYVLEDMELKGTKKK